MSAPSAESRRSVLSGLSSPPRKARPLGTFLGVYLPTVLTILGVILYLRFGWVAGHGGLLWTLAIVVLANGITLITTLSLSAVATNTRVGVGGAYYLISRSLGLEIGGAIGVPLFLSQALSVTLYAFGLAESLRLVWPGIWVPGAAVAIILAVAALALRGAEFALRTQLPILGLIALSLVALAAGALGHPTSAANLASAPSGEVGFWTLFAVFFPAVTGIMAGLGLSGDLREPQKAIPRGTIAAQLTGFAVYLSVPVLLLLALPPGALRSDPLVWARIAPLGAWLVVPGLWGAIFSSAVGSILGASRTLQALAIDGLSPQLFARSGAGGEPRMGLVVTVAIALCAVLLGDLNSVAVVVSMFFLTIYGTLNLSAALEQMSGDPSWRPTLTIPWPVSLLGALSCFGVMLLIHVPASLIALLVEVTLFVLLQRRERRADWGDVRRGVYQALIRWALVRLARRPMTARSWRPHVLVFTEPERRLDLVRFGEWMSQDRGVVTVCELIVGELLELGDLPAEREEEIQALMRKEDLVVFPEVNVVGSIEAGIVDVAQANGMAGLESNTVLLGWPEDPERLEVLLRVGRRLELLRKSLLVGRPRAVDGQQSGRSRKVDVWWGGLQRNGDLMLLLAHLLTRNREWRDARIRVLSLASNDLMRAETERQLGRLMPEIRIHAEVNVLVKPPDVSVKEVIHSESAAADLVLLGLATPEPEAEAAYARRLCELAEGLESFLFVKNNSVFIGDLVSAEPAAAAPPPAEATRSAAG